MSRAIISILSLSSFKFIRRSYKLFFKIEFLDRPILIQMRLKIKFKDRDDITEQVRGPRRVTKFRNLDDTTE